jgi:Rrf2 family protein
MMTVIFSKKCELALQAVLFLSAQPEGKVFNSLEISNNLKAPKEFISKVLQTMTEDGIVGSKKGKSGGFYLGKPANEIRLLDIVIAIDGLEIFHKCVLGFPGCSPDQPCPMHNRWGKLREETYNMLRSDTLEDLKLATQNKLKQI